MLTGILWCWLLLLFPLLFSNLSVRLIQSQGAPRIKGAVLFPDTDINEIFLFIRHFSLAEYCYFAPKEILHWWHFLPCGSTFWSPGFSLLCPRVETFLLPVFVCWQPPLAYSLWNPLLAPMSFLGFFALPVTRGYKIRLG